MEKMFTKKQVMMICLLIVTSLCSVGFTYYVNLYDRSSHTVTTLSKDCVLRLHVIANSDDVADQQLKNQVRDAIINKMAVDFKGTQDARTAKIFVQEHLNEIEEIAVEEIKVHDKNYSVSAQVGEFSFPTKIYGTVTLPAGEYQALRVVIGEGKGSNWWCVLFPPLCFVDMPHGLSMNKSLDEKDIEKAPVEFRLKLLEKVRKNDKKHILKPKKSLNYKNF